MTKDTLWYPHRYNLRGEDETAALISAYGATGYGVYNMLVEMLHEDLNSRIEHTEKKLRRIAGVCKVSYEDLGKILDDCFNVFDLFVLDEGFIVSTEVIKNKEEREQIRNKRVDSGKKGGIARAKKYEASATGNEASAIDSKASATDKLANGRHTQENNKHSLANGKQLPQKNATSQASATEKGSKMKQNVANPSTEQNNTDRTDNTSPPTPIEESDMWVKLKAKGFSDEVIRKKIALSDRIAPYVTKKDKDGIVIYGKDLCNDFWFYWGESDQKTGKLRYETVRPFEIEPRLRTFKKMEWKGKK